MRMNALDWKPFEHENFEFKQQVLNFARVRNSEDLKDVLMAILIYVNAVDYVASHLITNLRKMSYFVLHGELNAQMFYENSNKTSDAPLHTQIDRLKNYDFPNKTEFLMELTEFKNLRKKYVHNFLSLTTDEINRSGAELDELYKLAESILSRYDTIARGITDTWIAYKFRRLIPPAQLEQPTIQEPTPEPTATKKKRRK